MTDKIIPPIAPPEEKKDTTELPAIGRYRQLATRWRAVMAVLTAAASLLAINQIFALGFFIDYTMLDGRYLYLITGLMLSMVFITFPSNKNNLTFVPWYDKVIIGLVAVIFSYFAFNAERIILDAWEYAAPLEGIVLALITWVIILEAGRRAGGWPIFFIVLVLSLYPTYADKMPAVVAGIGMPIHDVAIFHVLGEESVFGVALNSFAMLVFGFILFGVSLQYTGGGPFFINLAFALLGHMRGGPAKVAIFSSGLMGSMSGGPITNVLTTGPLSIPAMQRVGFSRGYAAGVEACASTGGVLMPPIMGATAFVMASFLGVSYVTIAVAAIVPSVLYFFGLFVQIDAYAARNDLRGLPKPELPKLGTVFKEGWYFIAVFVILTVMLVYMQREATAPFIATAALLIINQFTSHRMDLKKFMLMVAATGRLMAELAGILAAIGLIVGALAVTGMAGTLANDLVYLAGDNTLVLLIMGAITSFVLGIGMTVTAAYIFLAIVLAPALINAGLDPLAAHMFIMYWGMLSFITPPVALAAFAAASVAQVSAMRAGWEAMRLGAIIYFIPFFFVFNPALLLQGDISEAVLLISTALLGVALLSAGLQGYLIGFGRLGEGRIGLFGRGLVCVSGLALAAPSGGMLGYSQAMLLSISAVLLIGGMGIAIMQRRQQSAAAN
ncbi:TRAP transporter fused permease subunit [Pseudohongiella sp. SYSU M77423]|uniref:TRAP transporter permease n=1 Tax=Pseudohongiella sp. SYSU M77423 TaxID=3042312 RepID=UPI002481345C|nr:TRAP transporter fused permease subunit [Pseudohongiella sp. SYSU M77423]MDH7944373.1 TRAP transporter fused permease subunit [Pseudohongiella sp. SYSU M77423]MEC8860744.1 TRAP transporter fused permease subunit [Pseudomonadota bacterium]